jgi:hypothetical protein
VSFVGLDILFTAIPSIITGVEEISGMTGLLFAINFN